MKVLYHHIPRTSGNSIARIAEKNYKQNFFRITHFFEQDLIDTVKNKENFFIFVDSFLVDNEKISELLKLCDLDFTFVRNPIDRFESLYNIWIDNNKNFKPYMISDSELTIDEFYLECKKQNKTFFLNNQNTYIKNYNPNYIFFTENFSSNIEILKNIGVFNNIDEEDLTPSNTSSKKYSLSTNLREDYKNNYPEDFTIEQKI